LSLEANLHLVSALPSVLPDPETSFSSDQEHDERQSFCSSVRAEAKEVAGLTNETSVNQARFARLFPVPKELPKSRPEEIPKHGVLLKFRPR
jgi:hypothetical protein